MASRMVPCIFNSAFLVYFHSNLIPNFKESRIWLETAYMYNNISLLLDILNIKLKLFIFWDYFSLVFRLTTTLRMENSSVSSSFNQTSFIFWYIDYLSFLLEVICVIEVVSVSHKLLLCFIWWLVCGKHPDLWVV